MAYKLRKISDKKHKKACRKNHIPIDASSDITRHCLDQSMTRAGCVFPYPKKKFKDMHKKGMLEFVQSTSGKWSIVIPGTNFRFGIGGSYNKMDINKAITLLYD